MGKTTRTYILVAVVACALLVYFIFFINAKNYDNFAQCLSDKGFIMAGTEWCPHCKTQKSLFKGSFENVIIPAGAYKDCDVYPDWCKEHGVPGYPTWVLPDNTTISGTQKLTTLETLSGCTLP